MCICVYECVGNCRALTLKPQWAEGWERGAVGYRNHQESSFQKAEETQRCLKKCAEKCVRAYDCVCVCIQHANLQTFTRICALLVNILHTEIPLKNIYVLILKCLQQSQ